MTADAPELDNITHWAPPGACESLHMLRLDRIHPVVSGNKLFKLQPNLDAAARAGFRHVLSFGGGYSNHLVALAFAAREAGVHASGIVRGHYPDPTPSLQACLDLGMTLTYAHSAEFSALKDGGSPILATRFPEHFIIPEGGANASGISGASRIAQYIPSTATDILVAVGTGTTLAGLDTGLAPDKVIHGYCAARDCSGAAALLQPGPRQQRICFEPVSDPRFGRWKPDLIQFMRGFYSSTGIRLDVVYTGKMMHAVAAQLKTGMFGGKRLVCLHTGGLQGNPAGLFDAAS